MKTNDFTTISLRRLTYERLKAKKLAPRDSFENVLKVLLDKMEEGEAQKE